MTPSEALRRDLDDLLRRCVQCGLCLPHCATWLATGNEVQSPRGRLVLLEELLAPGVAAAAPAALAAFDQCIGCRACETACPSGVSFRLLEHGKELAQAAAVGPGVGWPPAWLLARLDEAAWLRRLARAAGWGRGVLRALLGEGWRRRTAAGPRWLGRLGRSLGSMPRATAGDRDLVRLVDALVAARGREVAAGPPSPPARPWRPASPPPPVVLFSGCANAGLLPAVSARLAELLRACGCRVTIPAGQACCGALASHDGRPARADALARRNRAALDEAVTGGVPILVEAAGCGLELRQGRAALGAAVNDAVAFLARLELPPLRPLPLRVAVHDPCHARHGQGILAEPRALLRRIPQLELVEAAEGEVCCGSGGAWGLQHPELSERLARRKAALLAGTGCDLIVTSNPGCLGQIADGLALEQLGIPILPLTDLVWVAARRGSAISDDH